MCRVRRLFSNIDSVNPKHCLLSKTTYYTNIVYAYPTLHPNYPTRRKIYQSAHLSCQGCYKRGPAQSPTKRTDKVVQAPSPLGVSPPVGPRRIGSASSLRTSPRSKSRHDYLHVGLHHTKNQKLIKQDLQNLDNQHRSYSKSFQSHNKVSIQLFIETSESLQQAKSSLGATIANTMKNYLRTG